MKSKEKLLEKAKEDEDVLAVYLFGSRSRGDFHEKSDTDICIVLKEGIKGSFDKMLDYKALETSSLDVSVFQELPLQVRKEVLKDGELIHCKDEDQLYDLAFDTIKSYNMFEKRYKDYMEGVA